MFNNEKLYGITMAIAKSMLDKGIITIDEYEKFNEEMTQKYTPIISTLIASIP